MATRRLQLRYPATCSVCRRKLAAGTDVEWNAEKKTAVCLACTSDGQRSLSTGQAGASAWAEADRKRQLQHERHERIKQARPVRGRIALAVSAEADAGASWAKGAGGEERLGRWLDGLQDGALVTLHDRRMPRSRANIDHLVVAPAGVWVIDAKRYKGVVEQRDVGSLLRADVRLYVDGRDRSALLAGVGKQVEYVNRALADLELPVPDVRGVLCFVEADVRLFAKPFILHQVLVTWPKALRKSLLAPGPVAAEDIQAIRRHLAASFQPASWGEPPPSAGRA